MSEVYSESRTEDGFPVAGDWRLHDCVRFVHTRRVSNQIEEEDEYNI